MDYPKEVFRLMSNDTREEELRLISIEQSEENKSGAL